MDQADEIVKRYMEQLLHEKEKEMSLQSDQNKARVTPKEVATKIFMDGDPLQLKKLLDYRTSQKQVNAGERSTKDKMYIKLFEQTAEIVINKLKELEINPEHKASLDIWVVDVAKELVDNYGFEIEKILENPPEINLWKS